MINQETNKAACVNGDPMLLPIQSGKSANLEKSVIPLKIFMCRAQFYEQIHNLQRIDAQHIIPAALT